jgi:hypothetical protein
LGHHNGEAKRSKELGQVRECRRIELESSFLGKLARTWKANLEIR